ncbi:MAG TPA: hypothetical protein VFS24_10480, partial [Steroidobacteraceae bacterium]|nr:hypothetical protein [Steroidobacteraceae bacterium]
SARSLGLRICRERNDPDTEASAIAQASLTASEPCGQASPLGRPEKKREQPLTRNRKADAFR